MRLKEVHLKVERPVASSEFCDGRDRAIATTSPLPPVRTRENPSLSATTSSSSTRDSWCTPGRKHS